MVRRFRGVRLISSQIRSQVKPLIWPSKNGMVKIFGSLRREFTLYEWSHIDFKIVSKVREKMEKKNFFSGTLKFFENFSKIRQSPRISFVYIYRVKIEKSKI